MAGRIPKKFIEDLLMRVDIVDVIDARVPLRKMGKEHKACCPFHEEKTPSFTVSSEKQFYHCFGCGAHGSAIGFLMEYERMGFPEAIVELAAQAGLAVPMESQAATPVAEAPHDLAEIMRQADRFYRCQLREHSQAQRAVEYLKRRGVNGEMAMEFGLGYAPPGWDNLLRALGDNESARKAMRHAGLLASKDGGGDYDRFRNRLMFPIHDYRGRLVGFGGRVLADDEPKYLNSPETPLFHKGREMYGLYRAREAIKREQQVVVVEGYMDVLALAQSGIGFAVATLGTATTRHHLERIFRFAPEVIFCFDGDRAGREAAWRALENALPTIHHGRQVGFLFLPEGEDPDSLVRKEGETAFLARIPQARPLPDYFFDTLISQVNTDRMDGRARLVELALPYLSNLPAGVLQQMMLQRLAESSRISAEKLSTLLKTVDSAPNFSKVRERVRPVTGLKQPPSVMRTAIALLLQYPQLALKVPDRQVFMHLELPGMPIFMAILDKLSTRPELNTAAILEHFRGSEHLAHLEKLVLWQHPVLEQDVEAEFQDTLIWMRKTGSKRRTEQLLNKQRIAELTQAEKSELSNLLIIKRDYEKTELPH